MLLHPSCADDVMSSNARSCAPVLVTLLHTCHPLLFACRPTGVQLRDMYGPQRTRLWLDKARNMLYVASTWRVHRKVKGEPTDAGNEEAFWAIMEEEAEEQAEVLK